MYLINGQVIGFCFVLLELRRPLTQLHFLRRRVIVIELYLYSVHFIHDVTVCLVTGSHGWCLA